MTRRRRRRYGIGIGNGNGVFNAGTAINVFSIPVITGLLVVGGFYFLTKDELARHEAAIAQTLPAQLDQEKKEREKTRNEFLDKIGKLGDLIATLNTNIAVQTQALAQIKDELRTGNGNGHR